MKMQMFNCLAPIAFRSAEDENGKMIVEGTAIRFDVPNLLGDDGDDKYYEVVVKGACDGVDFSKTILRYNHDDSVPALSSCRNKSMIINVSDTALTIHAELADTSAARDVYELVKEGAVGGLSIAFMPDETHYDGNTRYIDSIKFMPEISIVDFPAYGDNTDVEAVARSIEKMKDYRAAKKELVKKLYFE